MTAWPPGLWLEWWKAQKGFRRTRSYGLLYKAPPPAERRLDMAEVRWVGMIDFSAGRYWLDISDRGVDLIPEDNFSCSPGGADKFTSDYPTGPPH